MIRPALAALFASLLFTFQAPALAQQPAPISARDAPQAALEQRAEQVVALLNGEIAPEEIFTDGFLASVPPAQFVAISKQLTGQFGPALAVESLDPAQGTQGALAIRMERAVARGSISIDPASDNRINGLLFQSFDPVNDTPTKIEADLRALPGEVSWWFGPLNDGQPVMAGDARRQMPIGSTFKLYVLAALARQVEMGEMAWNDVYALDETRSFPSGTMQDWPLGAPVTLHTLASQMISISDNTATDALIRVLGRERVFEVLVDSGHDEPELNDPFLTTREMFLLKAGPQARLEAYRSGDADLRREILGEIEELNLGAERVEAAFMNGPVALDVEWFASALGLVDLLRMMQDVGDPEAFRIMTINPNAPLPVREKWSYIGYKGGSEPGVLNLTWLLTDKAGRDHALVLSWRNDEANLDATALELIGQRILSLPR
jgi:beta-lactamase class A